MRTREEQREERHRYESDVAYEVWRSGGDMDRVDVERVENHYYDGHEYEQAVRDELKHQQPRSFEEEVCQS